MTQAETLRELNKYAKSEITRSSFSKRVKKGQIRAYYKANSKKKFYKLNEVAKIYNVKIESISSITPNAIKENARIYNSSNINELNSLLLETENPLQRVQIIKNFWNAKIKEARYREVEKNLIPLKEANAVFECGILNFRELFKTIPNDFKSKFPNRVSNEMVEFIGEYMNEAFKELEKMKIKEHK